ncbi:hypothetical protein NL676_038898 [Syzygium grande]|nr:hypothetical protein NL676_038898 [Syzygium grande]
MRGRMVGTRDPASPMLVARPVARGFAANGLLAGGGVRKGMEGILGTEVGMLGIGGKVSFGTVVGTIGKLGSGGRAVVGSVGWVVGNVGIVG